MLEWRHLLNRNIFPSFCVQSLPRNVKYLSYWDYNNYHRYHLYHNPVRSLSEELDRFVARPNSELLALTHLRGEPAQLARSIHSVQWRTGRVQCSTQGWCPP